ncbi:MAG: hypothetical protein WDW38_005086 [Sanguina aurantia]
MESLLLRSQYNPKAGTRQTFSEYRDAEQTNVLQSSVTSEGALLEYETLQLRVTPQHVVIDNDSYDDRTLVTVDSANRPGTLTEIVQLLTELGLNVKRARISSDGGWFVDEFHVQEDANRKVVSERKLRAIHRVLSVQHIEDSEPDTPHPRHPSPPALPT